MLSLDLNLVFTIINLIIFYLLMKKFLFRPVAEIMKKREEKLKEDASQAEKLKEEAESLKRQYEEALAGAEKEGEEILKKSREKAEAEYDDIVRAARLEEKEIIRHADEVAAETKEKTIREAQHQITDLAMEAAMQIISNGAGAKRDEEIMNDFLTQAGVMK